MRLKLSQAFVLVLFIGLFFLTTHRVYATAIAESDIAFSNLQINPEVGDVEFLFDWELEAFAEAQNSLGEFDQDFDFSFFGGMVQADAFVTWADGHGAAIAPAFPDPPTLDVEGFAASHVDVPGCDPKWASSLGRGTLINEFIITGGMGTVDVDFSVDIAGEMHVKTDECGVLAETEIIFAMELDGDPILFFQDMLSIGPNSELQKSISLSLLAENVSLEFDTPYFLLLEVDSESVGIVEPIPEPSTMVLTLVGLGALVGFAVKRRLRKGGKNEQL